MRPMFTCGTKVITVSICLFQLAASAWTPVAFASCLDHMPEKFEKKAALMGSIFFAVGSAGLPAVGLGGAIVFTVKKTHDLKKIFGVLKQAHACIDLTKTADRITSCQGKELNQFYDKIMVDADLPPEIDLGRSYFDQMLGKRIENLSTNEINILLIAHDLAKADDNDKITLDDRTCANRLPTFRQLREFSIQKVTDRYWHRGDPLESSRESQQEVQ